jgi:hypothetical protein
MFQRLFQRFRGNKAPTVIDKRERDALIRENAEARGEALGRSNKEVALGDKSIDQVSAPWGSWGHDCDDYANRRRTTG